MTQASLKNASISLHNFKMTYMYHKAPFVESRAVFRSCWGIVECEAARCFSSLEFRRLLLSVALTQPCLKKAPILRQNIKMAYMYCKAPSVQSRAVFEAQRGSWQCSLTRCFPIFCLPAKMGHNGLIMSSLRAMGELPTCKHFGIVLRTRQVSLLHRYTITQCTYTQLTHRKCAIAQMFYTNTQL